MPEGINSVPAEPVRCFPMPEGINMSRSRPHWVSGPYRACRKSAIGPQVPASRGRMPGRNQTHSPYARAVPVERGSCWGAHVSSVHVMPAHGQEIGPSVAIAIRPYAFAAA